MSGYDSTKDLEDWLANFTIEFDISNPDNINQFTPREIVMMESLLTPGIQTSISADSFLHNPIKDYNDFKNKTVKIKIVKPNLAYYDMNTTMDVEATIYRLQNRYRINNGNETLTFQACHYTLLEDARRLISRPHKCTTPSAIVRDVLQSCIGASNIDVEDSQPVRDYAAQNIHPFKVIADQADVALANGTDPSFIHFMTYRNKGTHHFRSLYNLTRQDPVMKFTYSETSNNLDYDSAYKNPYSALTYTFPCDFDLLSDLLNGIDVNGSFIGTSIIQNVRNTLSSAFNFTPGACALGTTLKLAMTNTNTDKDQLACGTQTENYLLVRQARMNLLAQDKIALRFTVPWNPNVHAGDVVEFNILGREIENSVLYGSGKYLIHSMTHTVKLGGYSTTTMDCVSTTVGEGIV